MRTRLLPHILFMIILVGSLVANQRASDALMQTGDHAAAILNIARAHGLALRRDQQVASGNVRTFVFDAPGCAQPVSVALLSVTFEEIPLVPAAREPRDQIRYVYINHVWNRPDRLGVFIEWKKQRLLTVLGLTRYVPSRHLLLIDTPSDCGAADEIDWQSIWDRQYLTRIGALTSALAP